MIRENIVTILPNVLEQISKIEFETPNGMYHTEFTSAPWFTDAGIIFDLGIFRGSDPFYNTSLSQSILKRQLQSGFRRPLPSRNTDLQPFLTDVFLEDLKVIVFESINSELSNMDLISNNSVSIPFSSPLQVNITYFKVDENEILWHPETDIRFIQDAIHIDIGISFKIYAKYQTNSRFILPTASLTAEIQNFRVITDVGFNLINQTLYPNFKKLNITMQNLNVIIAKI